MQTYKYQKIKSVQDEPIDETEEEYEPIEEKPKQKKKKVILVADDDETPNVISYSKAKTLKPRKPMSEAQKQHNNDLVESNKIKFAEYRKIKQEKETKKHNDEIEMMARERLKKVVVKPRIKRPNKNHPFKQVDKAKREPVSDTESVSEIIESSDSEIDEEVKPTKKKTIKYEPIQKQRQPKQIIEDVNKTIERIKEIDKQPINPYIALIKNRHR